MDWSNNQLKKVTKKLNKFQHIVLKETGISCNLEPTNNIVICNAGLVNGLSVETVFEHFKECGEIKTITLLPQKSCTFLSYKDVVSAKKAYDIYNGKLNIAQDSKPIYILFCESMPKYCDGEKSWDKLPPGLMIIEDFITPDEEEQLVALCNFNEVQINLDQMKHRQVKHFGYEFRYDINNVDKHMPLENQIPEYCIALFERLKATPFKDFMPNQLTVNSYKPGQGIPPHVDTHSAFEDPIMSLSLLSSVIMEFRKDGQTLCVNLPRRSLAIMSNESRYAWTHGITPRKFDIVVTENKLSSLPRGHRISFTFRKILNGRCNCKFKSMCDSHSNENEMKSDIAAKLEKIHVHEVYENIATHFSDTRNKLWQGVLDFVESFSAGSILLDVGCGNGKYMNENKNIFKIGCDTSFSLLNVCRERGFEVYCGNCLNLPLKDDIADGAICIAVIHHLGNEERRSKAIQEIVRILKIGGRALIYVWSKDQFKDKQKSSYIKQDRKHRKTEGIITADDQFEKVSLPNDVVLPVHVNRTQFKHKDVLVPWKLKNANSESNQNTFLRYYHVFEENELENTCQKINNVEIVRSYYEQGNWCIVIRKK